MIEAQNDRRLFNCTHWSLLGRAVVAWTSIQTAKFAEEGIGAGFSDGGAFILEVGGVDGGASDKARLLSCGD